ncbi:hypothetical protein ACFLVG_02220 [Chloroflexota bacterium]
MSRSRKLYILAAINVPLTIAVAILAWSEGNLRIANLFGIFTVVYGFGFVTMAWCRGRRRAADDTPYIASKKLPSLGIRERLMVWERRIQLFIFTIVIVFTVIGVYTGRSLYHILMGVHLIVLSGGILWYGGLFKE